MQVEIAGAVLLQIDHCQLLRGNDRLHIGPAASFRGAGDDPHRRQRRADFRAQRLVRCGQVQVDPPHPVSPEIALHRQRMRLTRVGLGIGNPAKPAELFAASPQDPDRAERLPAVLRAQGRSSDDRAARAIVDRPGAQIPAIEVARD